jgi:hypothetical protein
MLGHVPHLERVEDRVRAGSIWPEKDLRWLSLRLSGWQHGGSKSGVRRWSLVVRVDKWQRQVAEEAAVRFVWTVARGQRGT